METQDDPAIAKRKGERLVTLEAERVEGVTIADRLTRRAKAQTVEIEFTDCEGTFAVVLQQPTTGEMTALRQAQFDMGKADLTDDAQERICEMLERLSRDASLDYDFWFDGDYSMEDLIDIINKLFESIVERVKSSQSFR